MAQFDKPRRVLTINEYLIEGKSVNLDQLALMFNVSKRTIQRDLDELKMFYADNITLDGSYRYIYYDHETRGYKMDY